MFVAMALALDPQFERFGYVLLRWSPCVLALLDTVSMSYDTKLPRYCTLSLALLMLCARANLLHLFLLVVLI